MMRINSPEESKNRWTKKNKLVRQLYDVYRQFYRLFLNIYALRYYRNKDNRRLKVRWSDINYNRIAAVNKVLMSMDPNSFATLSYLEVGCASNALFDAIPVDDKVGVDPDSGGTKRMTSDDFFSENTKSFDLIFIDGLHTYEQVKRDIFNALNCVRKGGYILLHDMLPRNWKESHIPIITTGAWTGDVWKVAFELRRAEGLDFCILRIDHGVGIIRCHGDRYEVPDYSEDLSLATYTYFFDNKVDLPIIEWGDFNLWLKASSNSSDNDQYSNRLG